MKTQDTVKKDFATKACIPKDKDRGHSEEVTSTEQTLESDGWYRVDKGGKRLASARLRKALLSNPASDKTEAVEKERKEPEIKHQKLQIIPRPSQLNKTQF